MRRNLMILLFAVGLVAGCGDIDSPTTIDQEFASTLAFQVSADAAKDISVEQFTVVELEIQVADVASGDMVAVFLWHPDDGTTEYRVEVDDPGLFEITAIHRGVNDLGDMEISESALVDVAPMVITRVIIVPGQALIVGVDDGEIVLVNGDFEAGSLDGWTLLGEDLNYHQAVSYAAVPGYGGPDDIVPPYDGGTYGGYARTGGDVEVGFQQTIMVPAGEPLDYSVDFMVSETQIPGDGRTDQIMRLYLNGTRVAEEIFPDLHTEFSSFSGTYVPDGQLLTIEVVSLRPLMRATGWGIVVVDNLEVRVAR